MKKRLLTALVGIPLAIGWLFCAHTPVFSLTLAVFSAIAVFEMTKVFGVKNIIFRGICLLMAAFIPLYADYSEHFAIPMFPVITGVIILSLILMVTHYKNLKFEQVVCSLFSSFFIPIGFACLVLFRDVYERYPEKYVKSDGIFFILLAFMCSWLTDGIALFTGKAFGKHKLAPVISPKKTIEGAVGGVVGNTAVCVILYYVFKLNYNLTSQITLPVLIIGALLLSVISVFGDLAASTIKRHHNVKDFGNLLPGHGGVMDRFDSSLFVFPVLYSAIYAANM